MHAFDRQTDGRGARQKGYSSAVTVLVRLYYYAATEKITRRSHTYNCYGFWEFPLGNKYHQQKQIHKANSAFHPSGVGK